MSVNRLNPPNGNRQPQLPVAADSRPSPVYDYLRFYGTATNLPLSLSLAFSRALASPLIPSTGSARLRAISLPTENGVRSPTAHRFPARPRRKRKQTELRLPSEPLNYICTLSRMQQINTRSNSGDGLAARGTILTISTRRSFPLSAHFTVRPLCTGISTAKLPTRRVRCKVPGAAADRIESRYLESTEAIGQRPSATGPLRSRRCQFLPGGGGRSGSDPETVAIARVKADTRGRRSRSGREPPRSTGTRPSMRWMVPGEAAAEADGSESGSGRCKVDSRRLCCRDGGPRPGPAAPSPPSLGAAAAPAAADSAASTWSWNRMLRLHRSPDGYSDRDCIVLDLQLAY